MLRHTMFEPLGAHLRCHGFAPYGIHAHELLASCRFLGGVLVQQGADMRGLASLPSTATDRNGGLLSSSCSEQRIRDCFFPSRPLFCSCPFAVRPTGSRAGCRCRIRRSARVCSRGAPLHYTSLCCDVGLDSTSPHTYQFKMFLKRPTCPLAHLRTCPLDATICTDKR